MGRAKSKNPAKRQRSTSKASSSRGRSSSKGKGKAKQSRRSGKDKKRPKRALGPYMYYCKLNRTNVQKQNPNLSFGDIGRVLGSQWCRLSDKEKKKYVRKAQTDKRRYAKEMKRYKPK